MKIKSMLAVATMASATSTSSFAAVSVPVSLGILPPAATFENTVAGAFTDSWTFNLGAPSIVSAALSNIGVTYLGNSLISGIVGFSATRNSLSLTGPQTDSSNLGATTTVQVRTGTTPVPLLAGIYTLTVFGLGVTGGPATYSGLITAAAVPEPESYAMLLAGLGVMAAIAMRRKKFGSSV